MKKLLASGLFILISIITVGQNKLNYTTFNKLIEIKGTEYVIVTKKSSRKLKVLSKHLLFINTQTGEVNKVEFPKDSYFREIKQIRIDSLGINKVIVMGKTVNLDHSKSIDWNDPTQIIVLSTNGKEKTQLTENKFFTSTWSCNKNTGRIVIIGQYDSNDNGKSDKKDKSEILIYDLRSLKLVKRI